MMHLQPQDVYFLSKTHKSARTNISGNLYATTYQMGSVHGENSDSDGIFQHSAHDDSSCRGATFRKRIAAFLKIYSKDMRPQRVGYSTEIQNESVQYFVLTGISEQDRFYLCVLLRDRAQERSYMSCTIRVVSTNDSVSSCPHSKRTIRGNDVPSTRTIIFVRRIRNKFVPTKFNVDRDLIHVARFRSKQRLFIYDSALCEVQRVPRCGVVLIFSGFDFRGGNRCRENENS